MQVVALLNHKGGVGKSTLTANLGAGLAARGRTVLLVDLDPQANLSQSLFPASDWPDFPRRSVGRWLEGGSGLESMRPLLARPMRLHGRLGVEAGYLDVIAADHELDAVEEQMVVRAANEPASFDTVHARLRTGLTMSELAEYQVVLLDCAPGFGALGKSAIVACDLLLIPARPDSLSTNGIQTLGGKIMDFVKEFNGRRGTGPPVERPPASIIFTMIQTYDQQPIADQRQFIARMRDGQPKPFDSYMSDSKAVYGPAPENGVPVILGGRARSQTRELRQLVTELIERLEGLT